MRISTKDGTFVTHQVFDEDCFEDNNNGFSYGVELHQNGECINVEWFKTQEEQEKEYNQLNEEINRKVLIFACGIE